MWPIVSYTAKYASAFYGPFREAAGMPRPPSAINAATRWIRQTHVKRSPKWRLDIAEGADVIMVKPALAYLDVIRRVRDQRGHVPVAAYNVSGEHR